jgi:hypothetical protein
MILVPKTLTIINRTKHPNAVEKKVQQWKIQVLAKMIPNNVPGGGRSEE